MWQKWWQKISTDFHNHKISYLILITAVIMGSWLRFYKVSQTFMFEGDQGRDALVVYDLLKNFNPIAIGPVTSVGNMYLGPFYYYFMAPWLLLSGFQPIGPVIGVALMSILTIIIIYILGRKIIGERAAILSSILFAFSQQAINYARFSWNPNLDPLFAVLILYFVYQALHRHYKYWLPVGLCLGLVIQLHYVNLLLVAGCGLIWLYQLWTQIISKKSALAPQEKKGFFLYTAFGIITALLTLSTLFIFDFTHAGLNFQAGKSIFTSGGNFADSNLLTSILSGLKETQGKAAHVIVDLTLPNIDVFYPKVIGALIFLAVAILASFKEKDTKIKTGLCILLTFILLTILGISFYKQSVFNHYILFALPLVLMLAGYLLAKLWQHIYVTYICIFLVAGFIIFNSFSYNFEPAGATYGEKLAVAENIVNDNTENLQIGRAHV